MQYNKQVRVINIEVANGRSFVGVTNMVIESVGILVCTSTYQIHVFYTR